MIIKKTPNYFVKVVELLNDGEFHDGTSLGEKLEISRTAVWKIVKKLIAYGVSITSQKGKGYQLNEPLTLLKKTKLKQLIKEKSILIEVFESLPSTQDYLKALVGDTQTRLCLAEHQTKARGRFDRHWHAPFGKNINLSMLYAFHQDVSELAGLSLIVGLSLCKTLNSLYTLSHPVLMKWPNDLLCDHKKIAGILVEVKAEAHGVSYTNIGIGLNVNMVSDDKKITGQAWTSLKKITAQDNDRNILVAELINQLLLDLTTFSEQGFEPFLNEWKKYDLLYNKFITVKMGEQQFTGIAQGLNERGHLLLKLDDTQEMKAFSSGDTTIVKK